MGLLKATLFIVGTTIGAGFISGAELVRFFRTDQFVLSVLLSSSVFFTICLLFLSIGKRHGGYRSAMKALFGKGAPIVITVLPIFSFIPCAGMLAGLDGLYPSAAPFVSAAGLAAVLLFLRKGVNGISVLNLLLVPLLLCFVFFSGGELSFAETSLPHGKFFGGIVYAGMNGFLAAPVLMDAGTKIKRIFPPALCAAAFIALSAVCVLGKIYREGATAINAELPFLYVMHNSKLFSVAAALAILTSLASALYPLLCLCDRFDGKKRIAAKGVILLAAMAFSRLGLTGIVTIFYPVSGVAGLSFSALCILYEYLFQKRDKKIHDSRQKTQDTSRPQDEIKFKHLPAVNDQIAEPRPRNNVFAHDRADPAHAHSHFQHGNKRGKRGRKN